MKCPKCKSQLDNYVFDRDYGSTCAMCGYEYSRSEMQKNMEPEDCLLVREYDLDRNEFDPDCHCQDCYADCILARSIIDDWVDEQKEAGNCEYDD